MLRIKRAYEPASRDDGMRILVERLWPRGVSKTKGRINLWLKDLAPSTALRKWFTHDPAKWTEFRKRYQSELKNKCCEIDLVRSYVRKGNVTFVYAAKDQLHNSAVVLAEVIEKKGVQRESQRRGRMTIPTPRHINA